MGGQGQPGEGIANLPLSALRRVVGSYRARRTIVRLEIELFDLDLRLELHEQRLELGKDRA